MLEDFHTALAEQLPPKRVCAYTKWRAGLEPGDQRIADELVAGITLDEDGNPWDCRTLARYFQSMGVRINDQVLTRHRNGTCCGRTEAN